MVLESYNLKDLGVLLKYIGMGVKGQSGAQRRTWVTRSGHLVNIVSSDRAP